MSFFFFASFFSKFSVMLIFLFVWFLVFCVRVLLGEGFWGIWGLGIGEGGFCGRVAWKNYSNFKGRF